MRAKGEHLIDTPSATLIPNQPINQMVMKSIMKPKSDFTCDGADCGCKFCHIIGAIILIALLVPVVYVYIYVKSPLTIIGHLPG